MTKKKNKYLPGLIPEINTNRIYTAGDELCETFILELQMQTCQVYKEYCSVIVQMEDSCKQHAIRIEQLTPLLEGSLTPLDGNSISLESSVPSELYSLVINQINKLRAGISILEALKQDPEEDEDQDAEEDKKINQLASILLEKKDMFYVFNVCYFGRVALQQQSMLLQYELRDYFIFRARVLEAKNMLLSLEDDLRKGESELILALRRRQKSL